MNKSSLIFFDTETTGLEEEDKVISISYIETDLNLNIIDYKSTLCNPKIKINPMASMVHNITNKMVSNLEKLENTNLYNTFSEKIKKNDSYFLAYNAIFDWKMIKKDNLNIDYSNIIDLYRVAKHLYLDFIINEEENKKIESFKLHYMRYLFDFDDNKDFIKLIKELNLKELKNHDSLSDVIILIHFTKIMIKKFNLNIQDLYSLSRKPILENYINFGNIFEKNEIKYKDVIFDTYTQYGKQKDVVDYFFWAVNNMENLYLDTQYTLNYYIGQYIINTPQRIKYIYNNDIKTWKNIINFNILLNQYTKEEIEILSKYDDSLNDINEYKKNIINDLQDIIKNEDNLFFIMNYIDFLNKNSSN